MRAAVAIVLLACLQAASCRDGVIVGREVRRDGLLVADQTPLSFKGEALANQLKCQNACNYHGICITDKFSPFPPVCECLFMWSGDDCGVAACPNNCTESGECDTRTGVCHCHKDLGGADCSKDLRFGRCPNNCYGNGRCDSSTRVGVCECYPGWKGLDCSEAPCPRNCSFHGVCMEIDAAFGGGRCRCERGWAGADCSHEIKTCPGLTPDNHPCNRHGKCDVLTGTCNCTTGYVGDACQQRDCVGGYLSMSERHPQPWASLGCPDDCSCHGHCICTGDEETEDTCYCACEPGWGGSACTEVISDKVPYSGVEQPFPDKEIYPHTHPWLSDEERAQIALRRADLPPGGEEELLLQRN